MARRNALVRHLPAVETLGSATVILTDKTGTLTQNRMTVRELFVAGRHHLAAEALAACRRPAPAGGRALLPQPQVPRRNSRPATRWKSRCGSSPAGFPSSASAHGELPFDTERRRMSVIWREADGSGDLCCKGAPEAVFPLCTAWLDGDAARPFDADALRTVPGRAGRSRRSRLARSRAGLETAARGRRSAARNELRLCGLVGLEDPPRPDVHQAVVRCHGAGIRIIMVTGDHPHTALALAREVEVIRSATPSVLTGDALRHLSPAALQLALDAPEILFARVSAEQKMLVTQALQQKGEIVAVTGDGVNDAPALKTADIGIAMGLSGTDVAREAADIVLLDDHFATIVNAIEEGRAVFDNIGKFLTYILTSNIPELVPYLAFGPVRHPPAVRPSSRFSPLTSAPTCCRRSPSAPNGRIRK